MKYLMKNIPSIIDDFKRNQVNFYTSSQATERNSLLSCICVASAHERQLKTEEAHVKAELATISMIDEFAKYARMQRKLNKIQNELKTVAASRLKSQAKTKIAVLYAAQLVVL
ncbi:guided entry of tail-anchored proteins factor 1-like isoform X4 [Schistocerca cancellata]|uniref:guided entry of tail-anchored proteins factor 1-like isoform X4 n=1 Tax=Schistocerca cancellata TaxID=274614 RepID=UPI0021189682|nr:guided entry of tail-anchored proteins factor 1-like isoform X4 [Schistocerca cancellata]